jgi:hypothetical protein
MKPAPSDLYAAVAVTPTFFLYNVGSIKPLEDFGPGIQMSLPKTESIPDDPNRLPPARRRRARRLLAPFYADERSAYLDDLAHRTSPSFDFFLFSAIAAVIFSLALITEAPALLLLGALVAPFMGPVIGLSLGTVVGSIKLVLRSLGGLLIGLLLVFAAAWLAGYLSTRFDLSPDLSQAYIHAQLSWSSLLVLSIVSIISAAALANTNHRPGFMAAARVASVGLAYGICVPLSAAGFGLGSGASHLFPDGLVVMVIHLSWAALFAALALVVMGCRPLTLFGYTFGAAVTLMGVTVIVGLSGLGAVFGTGIALPTPTFTLTATITPSLTITPSPVPPTETPTPSLTPTQTDTPVPSRTPTATPMYAIVRSPQDGGARMRSEPGFAGATIQIYLNGTLLIVLDETVEIDGYVWVKVRAPDGNEGWMLASLLSGANSPPG